MKYLLLVVCSLLLTGCVQFAPRPGMHYTEFQRSAVESFPRKGIPELIGMNGEVLVYRLIGSTDPNIYYWFRNDTLFKVTQGELPQLRYQLEIINR